MGDSSVHGRALREGQDVASATRAVELQGYNTLARSTLSWQPSASTFGAYGQLHRT